MTNAGIREICASIYPNEIWDSQEAETLLPACSRPFPRDHGQQLQYAERLARELALIRTNNFARVFLQVKKILSLHPDVPHIVRGSSGSSLLCYLMGITAMDPILYNISLARFMNVCRQDYPDIDIDFPYNRRDEVYAAIEQTWPGRAARISNHVMYSHKTAVKQALKEAGIQGRIPKRPNVAGLLKEAGAATTADDIKRRVSELNGTFKNYSLHCGGIVIFNEENYAEGIPDELVLKRELPEHGGVAQIKLNKDETEDQGYIKIDVLSNRGLAEWRECASPERDLTWYPRRDAATEAVFSNGRNIGITFGESRGMRRIFIRMRPQNVDEIAIALALIRPAAGADGRKTEFLEQWRDARSAMYSERRHEALRSTQGDPFKKPIIFDDDAIQRIQSLLRCDEGEADRWRKAFAKEDARARIEFRRKAHKLGHSQKIIDENVHDLQALALYSFCKSHAISYAMLLWALAYEKAHNPRAFWVAALNHCHSEYRSWVHYREARCSGIRLTRNPPPYRLCSNREKLISITDSGKSRAEQMLLTRESDPKQMFRDLEQLGYWLAPEFLPGCHLRLGGGQMTLDGQIRVKFCGLIATTRTTTHNTDVPLSLICIGVDNGRYVDLVVEEKPGVCGYSVVEGEGILQRKVLRDGSYDEQVSVEKIRGVSLATLAASCK